MAEQRNIDIHEDIPPVPTDQTSSISCCSIFLLVQHVSQIVASVAGSWVSIVQEHPDHKIIAWFVGYASGLALMLLLPCVGYISARNRNPCLDKVMEVFWKTLICSFFPVWSVFGFVCFVEGSSSSDGPLSSVSLLKVVLVGICTVMYAIPGFGCAIYWLCDNGRFIWEKLRGAPDSPNALPTCKFQSKENGGGVILTAGTKKERTLSGEDVVCCICLGEYADNDELRELTCCSHFFHVECVDKWLKSKARCPLCQYEFGGAGGAAV